MARPTNKELEAREFDLAHLYHPQSQYTPEQKMQVAMYWVVTGSPKTIAKQTGIPEQTIKSWAKKAEWWPDAVAECRKEKQAELDGQLSGILDLALSSIHDRLNNGDEIIDKNGNAVRKKVNAADLGRLFSQVYDKRALLRGDPTARSERTTTESDLDKLEKRLKQIAQNMDNNYIDAERVDEE